MKQLYTTVKEQNGKACLGGLIAAAAAIFPQTKMKGICGGNGCSGCDRDRPPEANQSLHLLHKWYLQAADEAPAVGGPVLAMMWGGSNL